jgi:16S rRNA (uracil1498-N3)-methyltransferase
MNLFYTPDISADTYMLSEEESKHCVRVLRMRRGDELHLVDGRGGYYLAEIADDNVKKCEVQVKEKRTEYGKRDHYLHIACAPTKNIERFEWFLEKATEIGIDEITPIDCEHSERTVVKPERLNKVIISAMKQSIKAYLPKLNEVISFPEFVSQEFAGDKFIAHCVSGKKAKLKDLVRPKGNVLVLIGPEGDFSATEIRFAIENGFTEISLGNSRLRTETAALAACHTVELLNE